MLLLNCALERVCERAGVGALAPIRRLVSPPTCLLRPAPRSRTASSRLLPRAALPPACHKHLGPRLRGRRSGPKRSVSSSTAGNSTATAPPSSATAPATPASSSPATAPCSHPQPEQLKPQPTTAIARRLGRALADPHALGLERFLLRLRGPRGAGDDRPGVAHLLAGRRGEAGDVGDDRLGDLGGDELGRPLLGVAADLADHHDQLGLGVGLVHGEDVDEVGADDRVAADADDRGVARRPACFSSLPIW